MGEYVKKIILTAILNTDTPPEAFTSQSVKVNCEYAGITWSPEVVSVNVMEGMEEEKAIEGGKAISQSTYSKMANMTMGM
jgi:hypothetical protein